MYIFTYIFVISKEIVEYSRTISCRLGELFHDILNNCNLKFVSLNNINKNTINLNYNINDFDNNVFFRHKGSITRFGKDSIGIQPPLYKTNF